MKRLILILLLLPALVNGQKFPKEIIFIKNLDLDKWNKIVAKATNENKIIYIHYEFIENNSETLKRIKGIYNDKKVWDYLNDHFNCYFIPFKSRYDDFLPPNILPNQFLDSLVPVGKSGQPTASYFFTKEGKHLHKEYYVPQSAKTFIEKLQDVVNGKNNYYQVIEEYKNGNRSIEFFKTIMPIVAFNPDENIENYLKECLFKQEKTYLQKKMAN